MCSRFELNGSAREVGLRFGLSVPPPTPNRFEVRPTDQAVVIGPGGASRLVRFGLAVEWDRRPLINARAETLAERPAFRSLLERRVLVPASAWWEWLDETGRGKAKRKFRLSPAGGGLFAFAGLADEGAFVLVTRAAAPDVAAIHDRMPAVLPQAAEAAWLDPRLPFDEAARALAACRSDIVAVEEGQEPSQPDLFG